MPTILHCGGTAETRVNHPGLQTGLFFLDTRRSRLLCLNETARQLLQAGLPVTREQLARQPLTTLTGQPVQPNELPLLRAWREQAVQQATFVLARPDGSVQHHSWTASPLPSPDGGALGVSGTVVVTTPEPNWLELAGLAHDLRTPLQVLKLLIPVIESYLQAVPEAGQVLDRLRSTSDRAQDLARDLLEWCRHPLQGTRPLVRTWVPLAEVLETLATEQVPGAQRKGLALVLDLDEVRDLEVYTDRARFGRLLANLLTNAVRYTSAGEVRLSARWRDEKEKPRVLLVSVTDTGAGLSPEDQESIFQPFGRGRAGREKDPSGSGVGLAAVDRLVQELNLTLDVYSEQGQGSNFEMQLPEGILRNRPGG